MVAIFAKCADAVHGLDDPRWNEASVHLLDRQWNGDAAPKELATSARMLWTADHLFVSFSCDFTELDINETVDLSRETYALWDRDVCEIFVRSSAEAAVTSYKEFEVAPTGEWCDLIIDRKTMSHDWEWNSGMRTETRIDQKAKNWRAMMSIPFAAFGVHPESGSTWYANLFRVSRFKGERLYLAFSPTLGEQPNYHVPERFVPLTFTGMGFKL